MSIFLGDKLVTMGYLGDLPIATTLLKTLTIESGSLIHYFNANISASATLWSDTLTNTGSLVNTGSIRYISSTPSSSYYDFLDATGSNELFFGGAPLPSGVDRTVIVWIKPKREDAIPQLIQAMGQSTGLPGDDLVGLALVNGKLAYFNGGPSFAGVTGSLSSVQLNTWQQVAYAFVSSSQTVTMYKNNESTAFNDNCQYDGNLYWLMGDESALNPYSGSIANQLIYDRALTADEINENYLFFSQFYN